MEATMTIHMLIQWYGRNPDLSVNYNDEHHGTIVGNTPEECMTKYRTFSHSHDLTRFSRTEIVEIY